MSDSKLRTYSMDFAVSIIKLVKQLKEKRESIVSNQIGRSGTSIGANIREAQYVHSKADFISTPQRRISIYRTQKTEIVNMCMIYKGDQVLIQNKVDNEWGGLTFPSAYQKTVFQN